MEAHEEIGQSNPSFAWASSRSAFVVLIKGGPVEGGVGGMVVLKGELGVRGGTCYLAPQVEGV